MSPVKDVTSTSFILKETMSNEMICLTRCAGIR